MYLASPANSTKPARKTRTAGQTAFETSIETYRADRFGAPFATPNMLFWYPRPGVRIISAWGVVGPREVGSIVDLLMDELEPGFPKMRCLTDLTEIERLDPDAFGKFVAAMSDNADRFGQVIERSVYVHGQGNQLATSAVSGYSKLIGSPFPNESKYSVADGLEWLGLGHEREALLSELADRKRVVRDTFRILGSLRKAVVEHIENPTAATLAKALGRSSRTLQRELASVGTTLTAEVRRVRTEVAKQLLSTTDLSIVEIAGRVGFGTTKAFRNAFRMQTKALPSTWRNSQRHH